MDRKERLEREIDRDARIAATGYARELVEAALAVLQKAALGGRRPDPDRMFDEVDGLTRRFRRYHRDLGDARINRRGERPAREAEAPDPGVPPAARPFAYHGKFQGEHEDLEALARSTLDPRDPGVWAPWVDLLRVGVDLHLRGELWTVEHEGKVFAFGLDDCKCGDRDLQLRAADRARALLVAERGAEAADAAMRGWAGLYPNLMSFAHGYLAELSLPPWLVGHVDPLALVEDWVAGGAIELVDEVGGGGLPSGVHVFVVRDPLAPRERG